MANWQLKRESSTGDNASEDFCITARRKACLKTRTKLQASHQLFPVCALSQDTQSGALYYIGVNEENLTEVRESEVQVVHCLRGTNF